MSEIKIPTEILGDPEYDGAKETLTFFGTSAILIAKLLHEEREKRERAEREERLDALIRANAKRYSHRDLSASSLLTAFADFADMVKRIYEVQS